MDALGPVLSATRRLREDADVGSVERVVKTHKLILCNDIAVT